MILLTCIFLQFLFEFANQLFQKDTNNYLDLMKNVFSYDA
jgi:hypothetical protein